LGGQTMGLVHYWLTVPFNRIVNPRDLTKSKFLTMPAISTRC
jgi:hypothetical protein